MTTMTQERVRGVLPQPSCLQVCQQLLGVYSCSYGDGSFPIVSTPNPPSLPCLLSSFTTQRVSLGKKNDAQIRTRTTKIRYLKNAATVAVNMLSATRRSSDLERVSFSTGMSTTPWRILLFLRRWFFTHRLPSSSSFSSLSVVVVYDSAGISGEEKWCQIRTRKTKIRY